MKSRFFRGCKKIGNMVRNWVIYEYNCERRLRTIPSDVPKGHLVVYVGVDHKRHVINIALLHHPLFRALLDQAQEEYGFNANSKLCIPCDEHLFLNVVRRASFP